MIVPSDFPNGDAGAVRDAAFAKIYQKLGYDVLLIGAGRGHREGSYEGIIYYSIYKPFNGIWGHIYRFLLYPRDYEEIIEKITKKRGYPVAIHINDISEKVISHCYKFATTKNVPLIHDSTEWYSPCEFKLGKFDKTYLLKDRLNKRLIKPPIKVIGISTYLTKYFKSKGVVAERIPVIMDVVNTEKNIYEGEKIRLIYAGSPAVKDFLEELIDGFDELTIEEKNRLSFDIYGIDKNQLLSQTGRESIPTQIIPHGRVKREVVEDALMHSDFSLLVRPSNERYAKAGFPTKSVEAMAHGVAMMCNLSSDLDIYLHDMENSIIIEGYKQSDVTSALRRILSLSRTDITEIKKNARITAEKYFDYRQYIDSMRTLIQES